MGNAIHKIAHSLLNGASFESATILWAFNVLEGTRIGVEMRHTIIGEVSAFISLWLVSLWIVEGIA